MNCLSTGIATKRAEVAHAGERIVFAARWRGILAVATAVFQGVLYEFIATGPSTCRIWRATRCPGHAASPGTPQARRGLSAPRAAQPAGIRRDTVSSVTVSRTLFMMTSYRFPLTGQQLRRPYRDLPPWSKGKKPDRYIRTGNSQRPPPRSGGRWNVVSHTRTSSEPIASSREPSGVNVRNLISSSACMVSNGW